MLRILTLSEMADRNEWGSSGVLTTSSRPEDSSMWLIVESCELQTYTPVSS